MTRLVRVGSRVATIGAASLDACRKALLQTDLGRVGSGSGTRNPSRVISYLSPRGASQPALTIFSAVCILQRGRLPPGW